MTGHFRSRSADVTAESNPDLRELWKSLSKYLRLLLLGPVLVGLITFVAIDWAPKRYVSTALVKPAAEGASGIEPELAGWHTSMLKTIPALMVSPEVLKAAGSAGLELAPHQIKTRVNNAEGSIALAVTAASPAQAKQLADALLNATLEASRAKNEERTWLEAERQRLTDQRLLLETTARQLREGLSRASTPQETGALATAVPAVMEQTVVLEKRLALNAARLNGLSKASIATTPTLPDEATGPRRSLWSAIAALGTLCLLISAVLLHRARLDWRAARGPAGHHSGQQQATPTKPGGH